MNFATGNGAKYNNGLSSTQKKYTDVTELYINYKNSGLNIRVGRQIINTPLADSDDIRMVPNTFEAYIATYELNNFTFTTGNLQR